ncbi:hypothetical protein ACTA71_008950 [Dictyostelium dimigraforme]
MVKYLFIVLFLNLFFYTNGSNCNYSNSKKDVIFELEPFFKSGIPYDVKTGTTGDSNSNVAFNLCATKPLDECKGDGYGACQILHFLNGTYRNVYDLGSLFDYTIGSNSLQIRYKAGSNPADCLSGALEKNTRVTDFNFNCNKNIGNIISVINGKEPKLCHYQILMESSIFCDCDNCVKPHWNGICYNGKCQCDQYTSGDNCEKIKIEINSIVPTTIKGGIGYLIGDFQYITSSFDVFVGESKCTDVKLINSTTIEITVPPGDQGFIDVTIKDGMSSYLSAVQFQYINVTCLFNCSQPHGECNLFNGICNCDKQTIGNGCEELNIKIDSIISTTIKGGIGFLLGDFQFITSNFDVLIGESKCSNIKLINSSTIEITVPPGDQGFVDVIIKDEVSSYLPAVQFEYINVICLFNCSQPHGECNLYNGVCICDDQTNGEDCEILNIKIYSIISTSIKGGFGYLIGDFQFITSNFDVFIGESKCTDVKLLNSTTIEILVPPDDQGFKNVSITDGISSYISIIQFEYLNVQCIHNCSKLHGNCNLITGVCDCDGQTNGISCENSLINLESIDPTDGNGGTTYLYGYFGNATSSLYIQIGDNQCNNIQQVNQSLIQCDIGIGSGFKDVLLQDRDLKVKINNLFQYFVPITPNAPKQCIDNCGGPDQGLCVSSGCSCISPWIGNDCKSKIVFIPQPSTNYSDPSIEIPLFETYNNTNNETETKLFHSLISIVKLRELDFNSNEINSFSFKEWEYYKINNEISQYKTNFINLGFTTNITVTLQWFNNDSTIEFGNQIINMNPSTIKYTVEISEYKFSSKLNQLQLIMKASISVNKTDEICSDKEFGETSNGDDSNYLKVQVDNHSLYGRFIKRALIDSIPRSIDNVQLDSSMKIVDSASLSQSYIGISVPYFKRNIVLDPDFSLLIGSSPSSDNSICSYNSNYFSKTKIAAIVISSLVGIASISTIVIYSYYKTKYERNVLNELRLKISSKQVDILM